MGKTENRHLLSEREENIERVYYDVFVDNRYKGTLSVAKGNDTLAVLQQRAIRLYPKLQGEKLVFGMWGTPEHKQLTEAQFVKNKT